MIRALTRPSGKGWLCPGWLLPAAVVFSCLAVGCSSTKDEGGNQERALLDTYRGGRYQDREKAMAGLLSVADMKEQKGGIYEVRSGFERDGQAAAGGAANLARRDYYGGERAASTQAFRGGEKEFRSQAFDGSARRSGMGWESYEGVGESRMANMEASRGNSAMGGQESYGVSRQGSRLSSEDGLASPRERSAQSSQERNVRPVVVEDRSAGGGTMSESQVRSFLGKE